jgi:hypothetical protein
VYISAGRKIACRGTFAHSSKSMSEIESLYMEMDRKGFG